jgi:hypothetical protein
MTDYNVSLTEDEANVQLNTSAAVDLSTGPSGADDGSDDDE